jgi:hypothetical protein
VSGEVCRHLWLQAPALCLCGRRVTESACIASAPAGAAGISVASRSAAPPTRPGRRARVAAEIRLGVGRRAASRRQGALSPASGEPRPVRWRSGARRGGSCAEQSVQNLQPSEVDPSLDRGCRRGHTPRVVRARSTLATLLAASRDRVPGTDSRAWVAQGQWRIGRQPTRPARHTNGSYIVMVGEPVVARGYS